MQLDTDLVDLSEISFEDSQGQEQTIGKLMGESFTDALVVLKDGVIVTEQYSPGFCRHEPHLVMSVSKSIASALCAVLVDDGTLSVDDLVTDIIPEVSGSAYEGAKVRHLLDMTVDLDFIEDYVDPMSDVWRLDVAAGWRTPVPGVADNMRQFLTGLKGGGEHGHTFNYVSANTDLLGWILERAGERDFATLLSEHIWQPMGAEYDAYITLDRLGAPQADGGICVTARDLARFGRLHLLNGKVDRRQVVPAGWIQDFRENGDQEAWNRGSFAADMPAHHYRSKWYVNLSDSHRAYKGIGIHGQFVVVDPVSSVVIAHLASHPEPEEFHYLDDLDRGFIAISHYLGER